MIDANSNCRRRAGPPFLIGAHCSISGGLAEGVNRGAALKCTAIQIFTKNNNRWDSPPLIDTEIRDFQNALDKSCVKFVFAHSGYLINLASPDPVNHKTSLASMKNELERAESLELPFVVVHPGSHKGAGEKAGILKVVESINYLLNVTEGFKTKIVLETTAGQGNSLGYKFEHFSQIFERLPEKYLKRVGVCVDTAHIFAAGYDIATEKGYIKTWEEFKKNIGYEYLYAIHINDSAKELGTRVDRHENLGKGYIGLNAFNMLLNDKNLFHIPFVLETPKGVSTANDKRNLKLIWGMIGGTK